MIHYSQKIGKMEIEIDKNSGFCFGVINAVNVAENELKENHQLYCLGDIVHNDMEVERLSKLGLKVIDHDEFRKLQNTKVMIRAHGEPPETYKIALENQIELIDATCPVVLNLQKTILKNYLKNNDSQTLIFGKVGHAEVVGLQGQTHQKGIVISNIDDIKKIDFSKPAFLYAQTTQDIQKYNEITEKIRLLYKQNGNEHLFHFRDTICRRVSNRALQIKKFAKKYEMIVFVSGEKSSNGLYLFNLCLKENKNTHFISNIEQFEALSVDNVSSIGICGATSTPMWLMEEVKNRIIKKSQSDENL